MGAHLGCTSEPESTCVRVWRRWIGGCLTTVLRTILLCVLHTCPYQDLLMANMDEVICVKVTGHAFSKYTETGRALE